MITRERLAEVLDYDRDTGVFVWKKTMGGRAIIGQIAGTRHSKGYIRIAIDQKYYFAHRLALLFVNGEMPKAAVIDHIDGDPTNNRISNLRVATSADNLANRDKQKNNTSGHKGVYLDKRHGKWVAEIIRHNRKRFLGRYDDRDAAARAYEAAAEHLVGQFAFHNRKNANEERGREEMYQRRWRDKLTEAEKAAIFSRFETGVHPRRIADEFGIKCVSTVYRVAKKMSGLGLYRGGKIG